MANTDKENSKLDGNWRLGDVGVVVKDFIIRNAQHKLVKNFRETRNFCQNLVGEEKQKSSK